jgi:flagellar biosynthesis/type III secretory pathway chaperone
MSGPLSSAVNLADALEAECAGYQALLDLLHTEQEALRNADADALVGLAAAKAQHVDTLRRLANDRSQRLVAAGLPVTAAGMDTWIARNAQPQRAQELCLILVSLAKAAIAQNELNGRLLAIQRGFVDRAAAALWQAAGGTVVYGADGRPHRAGPARARAAV